MYKCVRVRINFYSEVRRREENKKKREERAWDKNSTSTYDRGMRHFTHIYISTHARSHPYSKCNNPHKAAWSNCANKGLCTRGKMNLQNSLFVTTFFYFIACQRVRVANKQNISYRLFFFLQGFTAQLGHKPVREKRGKKFEPIDCRYINIHALNVFVFFRLFFDSIENS